MRTTRDLILTAGPSISEREANYGLDAVVNGWNSNWKYYLAKFESEIAEYLARRYAIATSSCTGAMHLMLAALGVGPGDEVIVPDVTWVATVSVVLYQGATPVFADIDPLSWTMDPDDVKRKITDRTRAIIPVHLYGHPVDMDPIIQVAEAKGIFILEDAAPSLGAEYKGRRTGSLGNAAAFSFQGAKTFVTGEGGMLLLDDEHLRSEVISLWDHGRDPQNPLSGKKIGYKYKMSNVQAAVGLAQVERASEIVERKRLIHRWYSERLDDVQGVSVSAERDWAKSLHWMTSIKLNADLGYGRHEFMSKLKERNIDTRPVFQPLSSQQFIRDLGYSANNVVADDVGSWAINLPSGHERTEEEIEYIAAHIRDLVNAPTKAQYNFGWLDYRDQVVEQLEMMKRDAAAEPINLRSDSFRGAQLVPVTWSSLADKQMIQDLADWRQAAIDAFPTQSKVTHEGTNRWLENGVLGSEDRILFWVINKEAKRVGHVGLYRFDFDKRHCEIDNIVRGEPTNPGIMTEAVKELVEYTYNRLGIGTVYLRVFSDNQRAIKLYENCSFVEIQRTPLIAIRDGDTVMWRSSLTDPYARIDRYFVTMKHVAK